MAVETDRSIPEHHRSGARGESAPQQAGAVWRMLGRLKPPAQRAWLRLLDAAPFRFVRASIARRILVSNMLGLLVLLGGMLWLSQHQAWLITAKVESLKIQGEIIAAAIASNAAIDTDRIAFDQDRQPEIDGRRLLGRDDGFAAMELSLRPDRAAPVLRQIGRAHVLNSSHTS